jgi:hypothetical protein
VLPQQLLVAAFAVCAATGCVKHQSLLARGTIGWDFPEVFWPPPPPSSRWISAPSAPTTLGAAVASIRHTLAAAGYTDTRSYPIGADYAHGFAIATRLERLPEPARPAAPRWLSQYPEPANLRWLGRAREPSLPEAGRYRVFLVAFTDLPIDEPHVAPRWNDETWMEGPESSRMTFHGSRGASARFRVAVYAYEYASTDATGKGAFVALDPEQGPEALLREAGLSGLQTLGR